MNEVFVLGQTAQISVDNQHQSSIWLALGCIGLCNGIKCVVLGKAHSFLYNVKEGQSTQITTISLPCLYLCAFDLSLYSEIFPVAPTHTHSKNKHTQMQTTHPGKVGTIFSVQFIQG